MQIFEDNFGNFFLGTYFVANWLFVLNQEILVCIMQRALDTSNICILHLNQKDN